MSLSKLREGMGKEYDWGGQECKNDGAGDGDRTRDIQLGKLAFYR